MRIKAALMLATLACAGCAGSLLESRNDPPEVYRLGGPALAAAGPRTTQVIAVARPRAAASLDTDRIAVVHPGSRFDYFAGVRWAETAPQMLQSLLVRAVTDDGRFAAVVTSPGRVPADLLLDVELRRFEAEYSSGVEAPRVRVELQGSVIDTRGSRRIASFIAATEAVAAENRRAAVVAAFEDATDQAVHTLVLRLREAVDDPR